MQTIRRFIATRSTFAAACLALATLTACGGGSNGTSGSVGPDAPLGVTVGPIEISNPVFVNNIRWELNATPTTIDDADDDGRGLLTGYITRIQGGLDTNSSTGRGTSIRTGAELRGAVTAIDAARFAFTVLGVEVVTNAGSTFFENLSTGVAGIVVGDFIQVNGYPTHDNKITATRVLKRATNTVFKTTGTVSYDACTPSATTTCPALGTVIRIGGVNVAVSAAAVGGGLAFPVPEGTLVRIKASDTPTATGFTAASVLPYVGDPLPADAIVIMNGVSARYSAGNFVVNGIAVKTTSATKIVGTLPIDQLAANGSPLQIEGRYRSGAIEATSVKRL